MKDHGYMIGHSNQLATVSRLQMAWLDLPREPQNPKIGYYQGDELKLVSHKNTWSEQFET